VRSLIRRARALLRHLLGRTSLEREMDDEFQSHLAHRADDLERSGLSRKAAERAARVEFGALEAHKDAARDARGVRAWDELRANVGFAIRGIAHHPVQSLIVAITLTLGVGISGVVFAVMNALAFRARVDRDAASFVRIFASYRTDTTGPLAGRTGSAARIPRLRAHDAVAVADRRLAGGAARAVRRCATHAGRARDVHLLRRIRAREANRGTRAPA
jgi:hypothetical protein